jgi:AcrR family transcriptional regulator
MGAKDRRARQKTLLRQQILDAAREILIRDGYEKLSMRRVAERIDYSPTAIYLHFKDRQELVFSLCDETFARLVKEQEGIEAGHSDPIARLRKGMEGYIRFGLENPDHYVPAFVLPPPADLDKKRREAFMSPDSNGMRALAHLRDGIAKGIKAKKLRNIDPDVAARAAWAALHGITSLLIVYKNFPWGDRDALITATVDTILDGLRRR